MVTKIFNFINITTLIIFLSGCEVPSNGEEESYREDGTLKYTVTFEDGVVSKSEYFREDETLESIVTLENGVVSKTENFREDGTLEVIVTLEDGVVSKSETFREDRTLEVIVTLENGVVSKEEIFREDETLESIVTLENGTVSRLKIYSEDETLRAIRNFENGVLSKEETFREDETLESIVALENGFVSRVQNFCEDGTLESIVTLENGVVSRVQNFSEDGTLLNNTKYGVDAKVTSAVASVSAAKTAAIGYYQRYNNFPLDVDLATVLDYKSDPRNPVAYSPPVGALDFGDVLVRQAQLLEQEKTAIGRPDARLTHAIGCATVGDTLIGGAVYVGTNATFRFKSSGSATQIVYYFMPNLTIQEAVALASKVNGPFTADAVSDLDQIEASLAGNGIATVGGLQGANVWFSPGANTGEYNAYIYVSHE